MLAMEYKGTYTSPTNISFSASMTAPTTLANIYYDDYSPHHSSTSMSKQVLHPGIVQQIKCLV